MTRTVEIETPRGAARAHLHPADDPSAALVMGHGAGGGVEAPDLVAARDAAVDVGVSVALVEQPYRVAGRKSPPSVRTLDEAWVAVIEHLRREEFPDLPLIVGGRSLGARVACRTVDQTGPAAVVCLAFPLEPPKRGDKPRQTRLPELDAVKLPTLVVQGESDRFGMPPPGPSREVVKVPGDHRLKADLDAVADAVSGFLKTRAGELCRSVERAGTGEDRQQRDRVRNQAD
jgi:predicted alpha/beta-hydrolase family hydrolase